MTSRTAAAGDHPRAMWGLAVLSLINLLNYLDRYLIAGIMPKIQAEFGISYEQAGYLATAFVVVYMVFSPIGGYLGDRIPRRALVAASVFLWSLATLGSGMADTFALLLMARAFIGIGEAGYATVAPAVIADLFARHRRTMMMSFFYVAMPVGAAAGYGVAGYFAQHDTWKAAFYAAGIPGILLAVFALFMPEPVRGATEEGPPPVKVRFQKGLRQLTRLAPFWFNTAGQTLMTFCGIL